MHFSKITSSVAGLFSALGLSAVLVSACSTSNTSIPSDGGVATCRQPGGPVSGAQDTHCKLPDGGTKAQETNPASCHPDAGAGDAGTAGDGGMEELPGGMYNAEGDDDDCKYHVKWSSNPVCQGSNVTFTVTLTNKGDGTPVKGAPVRAEVFLNDTHPAPNTDQNSAEGATGTYTVGPIKFDAAGKWTVRFHFHEECADLIEDSQHGHAAFFVNVP